MESKSPRKFRRAARARVPHLVLAAALLLTSAATYYVHAAPESERWLVPYIFLGGLLLSLLLFAVTLSQVRARAAAEGAAAGLLASETRFRTMVEQSPLSTQIFSPDGRTLRVNRAWEKLWGVTLEQLGDYNILHDPQLAEKGILTYIRRGFAGHASAVPPILYDPEQTIPGLSEHEEAARWVQAFIYPVKDEGGRVREVVLVHEDISESKRAEEELQESEARFRTLIEATFDGIVIHERGRIIDSNRGFAEMFGYEPHEMTAKSILELVAEDNRSLVTEKVESGDEQPYEVTGLRKDGTTFNLEVTGKAHVFKGRRVRVSALRDVTERRRAEAERERLLRLEQAARARAEESEQRYRSLVVATSQLVWSAGRESQPEDMTGWNEFTGQTAEESGGRGWLDAIHPEDRARAAAEWDRAFETKSIFEVEYRLRGRGGDYRHVSVRGVPIVGDEGRLREYIGTVTDITERKRLDEQLRARADELAEANRLKDEFLATLSHELRTPLTSILGWAKLLRTQQFEPAVVDRALGTIERNAAAQSQLINDLLDVSRIITGKIRLNPQQFAFAPVVEAAVDSVRLAAEARGVRLRADLGPAVGPVYGDPDRLQQVVWNLLSNAIKFTPRDGRVDVRLARAGSHVEVTVSDTGSGISREFLPHVFERFRQANGAITREHGGLGLGLAIARHLVELHGGQIRAESPGLGLGTTFTVSLPLVYAGDGGREGTGGAVAEATPPAADSDERAGATGGALERIHVLVVDDDEDSRLMLEVALRQAGAEVTGASSAEEALAVVRLSRPDVLLSDIGMPFVDGYELIRRVRALGPRDGGETPAGALTAYARPEDRASALAAGYQLHIPKPVEPAGLVAAVRELAGRGVSP